MHADMHHTHLMHIPLARLYDGMVDALACTQTNHTRHTGHGRSRSTANLARHSLLSFRILLSTQESLAASHKCHFLCASFWQGVCFAVQQRFVLVSVSLLSGGAAWCHGCEVWAMCGQHGTFLVLLHVCTTTQAGG